jgi:hypothetical protein
MGIRSPLRQIQGRVPLEYLLIGLVVFGIILSMFEVVKSSVTQGVSHLMEEVRGAIGIQTPARTVVSVTPGQDAVFRWNDIAYADGRIRRVRFERKSRASAGLSAERKIVSDYDAFGRMVQEQDGTQDGRNLNVYRYVYRQGSADPTFIERHDLYIFFDGSAETADQYVANGQDRPMPGRAAIAGTYSTFLAEFLNVPEKPAVDPTAVQNATAAR